MSFAEQYVEVLDNCDLNHSEIAERDGREFVEFGMIAKDTKIKVMAIFEENIVSNRIWGVCKVPEDKLAEVLFACNEFNQEYKFTKFVIDSDYEVTLQNDAILEGESGGQEAFDLVASMIRIVDETYPKLMKVIWS